MANVSLIGGDNAGGSMPPPLFIPEASTITQTPDIMSRIMSLIMAGSGTGGGLGGAIGGNIGKGITAAGAGGGTGLDLLNLLGIKKK